MCDDFGIQWEEKTFPLGKAWLGKEITAMREGNEILFCKGRGMRAAQPIHYKGGIFKVKKGVICRRKSATSVSE